MKITCPFQCNFSFCPPLSLLISPGYLPDKQAIAQFVYLHKLRNGCNGVPRINKLCQVGDLAGSESDALMAGLSGDEIPAEGV